MSVDLKQRRAKLGRRLSLCLWLFPGLAVAAAEPPPSSDPVCGFASGPHFYYEAGQVKQGLAVEFMPVQAATQQPVTLRFFVRLKPRDFAVDRLQIEHEKFMHVIGVREDLQEFFHIHPIRVAPGVWEVTHPFARAGRYKVWSDLKYRGISYSFGHPLLTVTGSGGEPEKEPAPTNWVNVAGYGVKLTAQAPVRTGQTNRFQLAISDAAGNVPVLENFLGAPMHLVLVRDDLSVYLHAHPENRWPGEQTVRFRQNFDTPGTYKLFAQFRPQPARLPGDEALLAEFLVKVETPPNSPASR